MTHTVLVIVAKAVVNLNAAKSNECVKGPVRSWSCRVLVFSLSCLVGLRFKSSSIPIVHCTFSPLLVTCIRLLQSCGTLSTSVREGAERKSRFFPLMPVTTVLCPLALCCLCLCLGLPVLPMSMSMS